MPVFLIAKRLPALSPTTMSRSPSLSMSPSVGVEAYAHVDAADLDRRPEHGRRCRACVGDREQLAEEVAHDDIEVAVPIEIAERGSGVSAHIDAADLHGRSEGRRRRRAGVGDREQRAVLISHDDIEVVVAVEVGQSGKRAVAHIDAADLHRRAEDGRRRASRCW